MTSDWLLLLYGLAHRFDHTGITPDLAALSLAELWGLYCHLSRLAGD